MAAPGAQGTLCKTSPPLIARGPRGGSMRQYAAARHIPADAQLPVLHSDFKIGHRCPYEGAIASA